MSRFQCDAQHAADVVVCGETGELVYHCTSDDRCRRISHTQVCVHCQGQPTRRHDKLKAYLSCLTCQSSIIHNCASSLYALRVLRSHGLNDAALQTVYRAVVVTRLTYAISATADDRQRIERFLRRGTRSGFYRPHWPSVETLAEDAADCSPSPSFTQ